MGGDRGDWGETSIDWALMVARRLREDPDRAGEGSREGSSTGGSIAPR